MRRHAVAAGSLCPHTTGFRNEREIPFSLLEQFVHVPGIPDDVRSAVPRLFHRAPPATTPVPLLQEFVSALVVTAAGRAGLLVLVDDAQYADPASQSCLLHLARRLKSYDVTLAMAYPLTFHEGGRGHLEFVGLPGTRHARKTSLT
ncbi:hypothetical protein [Streptomyces sp. NPDC054794]